MKKISIVTICILIMQVILPIISNLEIVPKTYAAEILENQSFKYEELEDGSISIVEYTGSNQVEKLNIPESIDGKIVSRIEDNIFTSISARKITIPKGVKHIGEIYEECYNLKSINVDSENASYTSIDGVLFNKDVTEIIKYPKNRYGAQYDIPESVTSIADDAFYGCWELNTITISKGVVHIGRNFEGWSSLKNIIVDPENPNYTSVDGVVFNKEQTKIIKYPQGKTDTAYSIPQGVIEIGDYSLSDCYNLTDINIPEGVTKIGNYAFNDCYKLASITIPEGVTEIGDYAFYASKLTTITIPKTTVSLGYNAFGYIANLNGINVDSENPNYTSVDGVLFNKDKTKIISYPRGKTNTNYIITEGVKIIEDYAFYGCSILTSITIPQGVTNIGKYGFGYCSKLASITIPKGVTEIGDYAFYDCRALTNITIPEGVTTIGNYSFYNCDALTNVSFPEGVKSIGDYVFEDCGNLTNITIPSTLEVINELTFENCSKLVNISVNSQNSYYTSIDGVLFNKDKTKIIRYPQGKTDTAYTIPEGVTTIGNYSFSDCNNLTNIIIPEGVTEIGDYAFYYCYKLASITIPKGITEIGDYTFYYCYNLTSITIPEGVTKIGNYAFYNCSKISSITIPEGVTTIGNNAFDSCIHATQITIPSSVKSIGAHAFSSCRGVTSLIIPEGVTTIGDLAFYSCSGLTSITIPKTVTYIGHNIFNYCYNLSSIDVDLENPNYTSVDGVLFNKDKTKLIRYPIKKSGTEYKVPTQVKVIEDYAFNDCDNLIDIKLTKNITTIGDYAFYDCYNLTIVTIPEGVKTIGRYAFKYCNSLVIISIPNGVEKIGEGAFYNCYNLSSVTIPEGVTKIESELFYGSYNLAVVKIPEGVISIENSAFYGCNKLTKLVLPESLLSIERSAFSSCSKLTDVEIPQNVKVIGELAFSSCSKLSKITIPENVINIGINAFTSCSNLEIYANSDYIIQYAETNNIPYVIDEELPIITSIDREPQQWTKDSVTLVINAEDSLSGLARKAYSFDGGETWQEDNTKTYNNNTYGIVVKVKDRLGNIYTEQEIDITNIIELNSISITKSPDKTKYTEGESVSLEGMIVTAQYNDGSSKEVTEYKTGNMGELSVGETSIEIIYEENGISVNTYQNIMVESILLSSKQYTVGENKIDKVQPETLLSQFKQNIETNAQTIEIFRTSGLKLEEDDKIQTGDILKLNNVKSYTLIVVGDVNGDSKADFCDILKINKHRLNRSMLTGIYLDAAKINKDEFIDFRDILEINKFRLGKINKL